MHLFVKRVYPDEKYVEAILNGARDFEEKICEIITLYETKSAKLIKTERVEHKEMIL
jgi:hypothetical protein